MIEIYRNEPYVTVVIAPGLQVTGVAAYQYLYNDAGEMIRSQLSPEFDFQPGEEGEYSNVVVDVADITDWPTRFDIAVSVTKYGNPETIVSEFNVIYPYATPYEIAVAAGMQTESETLPNYVSLNDIREMEALARLTVEAYTGKRFGRFYEKVSVPGTDDDYLYSNEQIDWIGLVLHDDDVIYSDSVGSYSVSPSGSVLKVRDDSGSYVAFPEGYSYDVVGIFGSAFIPRDVNMAAKQLAVFFLCGDAATTNKYIDQVKFGEAADRYNRLAYIGTGLRSADLLLAKYRMGNFEVI